MSIKEKICKITNGQFSWLLEVDGMIIAFTGFSNADYFAELYKKLSYKIIVDDPTNTIKGDN